MYRKTKDQSSVYNRVVLLYYNHKINKNKNT
jgi:hypothetical protein